MCMLAFSQAHERCSSKQHRRLCKLAGDLPRVAHLGALVLQQLQGDTPPRRAGLRRWLLQQPCALATVSASKLLAAVRWHQPHPQTQCRAHSPCTGHRCCQQAGARRKAQHRGQIPGCSIPRLTRGAQGLGGSQALVLFPPRQAVRCQRAQQHPLCAAAPAARRLLRACPAQPPRHPESTAELQGAQRARQRRHLDGADWARCCAWLGCPGPTWLTAWPSRQSARQHTSRWLLLARMPAACCQLRLPGSCCGCSGARLPAASPIHVPAEPACTGECGCKGGASASASFPALSGLLASWPALPAGSTHADGDDCECSLTSRARLRRMAVGWASMRRCCVSRA